MSSSESSSATAVVSGGASLRTVALAGNPNSGKTTLFNALTGQRQKVGNYPGVTVEKKEGRLTVGDAELTLIDIPGIYSLSARSIDEHVARDVLLGRQAGVSRPDLIVSISDSSNLERSLYLTTQLMELGRPVVLALNMIDVAAKTGLDLDAEQISENLGIPVVPLVASRGVGLDHLRQTLAADLPPLPQRRWTLPEAVEREVSDLAETLARNGTADAAQGEAIRLLLTGNDDLETLSEDLSRRIADARARLEAAGIDRQSVESECRYRWIKTVCEASGVADRVFRPTLSDRIDQVLTHRLLGPLFFALVMALLFESIFRFAQWPMDLIGTVFGKVGDWVRSVIPPGDVRGLIAEGVIPGVGGVVTFLPQILFLSFFISLLEETGYMARAAFVADRLMRRVGLSGKSFIPLLSSFACAVPGILAARIIENRRDRLVTILIAPLMSCSARLPVYLLMIGAFFPADRKIGGVLTVAGAVMFSMYMLGIVAAVGMAWLFKKTLLRGETPPLIMELPPYRLPSWRNVLSVMGTYAGQFLQRAGTVILAISIVLWFLAAYPKNVSLSRDYEADRAQVTARFDARTITEDEKTEQLKRIDNAEQGERRQQSYLGQMGRLVEPVISPLGFNWKIGIGLISAFAAREVLVSTLAIVYSVGEDADEGSESLHQALRNDRRPDGRPVYTTLVALSLMVFFVLALQCMSTFAVVRRETNGWRWPFFMLAYMTVLAYVGSLVVYQGGRWLGFE